MSDQQCIMVNEGFYLLPAGENFIIELLIWINVSLAPSLRPKERHSSCCSHEILGNSDKCGLTHTAWPRSSAFSNTHTHEHTCSFILNITHRRHKPQIMWMLKELVLSLRRKICINLFKNPVRYYKKSMFSYFLRYCNYSLYKLFI